MSREDGFQDGGDTRKAAVGPGTPGMNRMEWKRGQVSRIQEKGE